MPVDWKATRVQVLERDDHKCVSCGVAVASRDADVHHLLPRSMGGSDELSNLVTLCDGCHASFHPKLAGGLARRWLERVAIRLAAWLDRDGIVTEATGNFGPALRLFGLDRFRDGQLPIVLAALAGKSVLVVSPTGFGKTLCFQLPAVLRNGVSIVVSPLKTLMSEQVSSLLRKKIPSTFINSDLSPSEKATRFSLLTRGAIKLLYLAPERFFVRDERERQNLKQNKPSFLVVDEAHCVDQWGKDFRREYSRLNEVREKLGAPPVLAFTATAGKEMQERILHSLGIPDAQVFVRGVDRPNIALLRWRCGQDSRGKAIASLLRLEAVRGQRAMIFVPSTKVGDKLREELRQLGSDVPFFHSRMGTAWDREQLLKRFMGESNPPVRHIICTNAFGMGLDVPDVRLVVHWQHSASVEDLLQEFGRAGRDGRQSVSVIFHEPNSQDASRLRFMAEKTVEASLAPGLQAEALEHRHRQIERVGHLLKSRGCFRTEIKRYFGEGGTVRRPSLSEAILEWAFGTKPTASWQSSCCDYCDAKTIAKVGQPGYVAALLARPRRFKAGFF